MKSLQFFIVLSVFVQCTSNHSPKVSGKTIYHDWNADVLYLDLEGQTSEIKLPTKTGIDFNNPIWLNKRDFILMTKSEKVDRCYNYSIVSFNLQGQIIDTVFKFDSCTILDFMPSPDDKLLLIRAFKYHDWYLQKTSEVTYLIYDMENKLVQDSILIEGTRLDFENFKETVWSLDSRTVLIFSVNDNRQQVAFTYRLGGEKNLLDTGSNFIFSPIDQNLVSYLKENKIVFRNLSTNDYTSFYEGRKNKEIRDFRWDPKGDFLVVNLNGHFLNQDSKIAWTPTSFFISAKSGKKSRTFSEHKVFDSWK